MNQIELITCPVCDKKYRIDPVQCRISPAIIIWSDGFWANEELLRTRLWWRINDLFRSRNSPELPPELRSLFEENLETLIYKTPPNGTETMLRLAEMHRELGLFKEAGIFLNRVKDEKYSQAARKLKNKICLRDKVVFLL